MKKQILNTFAVVALLAGVTSCKEDKNKTEVGEAQEVSVIADAQKFMVDTDASTIMWEDRSLLVSTWEPLISTMVL